MVKHFSKLRQLRESRGLRQIDLVIQTGLSPATIWHADKDDTIADETRAKIAKVLKVSIQELWPENSREQKNCTQT